MSNPMSSIRSQPKTAAQIRRIFGLARQRGIDSDELHAIVEQVTQCGVLPGKTSLAQLSAAEADAVISRLGGDPLASRRTIQHRRKRAGIVQIGSQSQLELLADLAAKRNLSVEGLQSLFRRMRVPYPPRTTKDTNKVIEALKAMNRRDQNSAT